MRVLTQRQIELMEATDKLLMEINMPLIDERRKDAAIRKVEDLLQKQIRTNR
jgi:hypothetical protein